MVTQLMEELNTEEIFDWPIKRMNIVLISGKAGVGKTTLATALVDILDKRYPLVIKGAFASGVKSVARNCFKWNGVKDQKGRYLLQQVGNLGRYMFENFWVEDFMDKTFYNTSGLSPNIIIVDDWRFPNESKYFIDAQDMFDLLRVRIISPEREILIGTPEYDDISETALDNYPFDLIIINDKSLEEFKFDGVNQVIQKLNL